MANPALVLIDIQRAFDNPFWGARNNPDAEEKAGQLLSRWRALGWPVAHVQHISIEEGSPLLPGPGTEFQDVVMPLDDEPVFQKNVNSGFIGTELEPHLRALGVTDLVICGLTTPHCVSTTTRMAGNLGFNVTLAEDACAAFTLNAQTGWKEGLEAPDPQTIHDMAVSHLHGEFATARQTDDILNDL